MEEKEEEDEDEEEEDDNEFPNGSNACGDAGDNFSELSAESLFSSFLSSSVSSK